MTLRVNGEPRELADGTTVAQLVDSLGLKRDGVAVAVDGQVIPRTEHGSHALVDGQAVEVIRAVGGG